MQDTGSDFTMTFRQLSEASGEQLEHGVFPQVLSHILTPTYLVVIVDYPPDDLHGMLISFAPSPQDTWALHDLSSHKLFSDWSRMYLLRLGR